MHAFLNGGGPTDGTKLSQEAFDVALDRAFGNKKLDANFLVAPAGGDTLEDFEFARA